MKKDLILAIETSCDETSIAIVHNWNKVLSMETATSIALHQQTLWVIPEVAARAQYEYINKVHQMALQKANLTMNDIDLIAVTKWKWLIWSLMIGIAFANTLRLIYNKPIVWIDHIIGHICANYLERDPSEINFPYICLTASWGHNEIYLVNNFNSFLKIWETLDDSSWEAFDKCWRLLWLGYPAWKEIEELATKGQPGRFTFPKGMIHSHDYNFSFSWLKTAFLYKVNELKLNWDLPKEDLAYALQEAICTVLADKVIDCAKSHQVKSIHLSWWVSANKWLRQHINTKTQLELLFPKRFEFCTDNAAMIWAAAYFTDTEAKKFVELNLC